MWNLHLSPKTPRVYKWPSSAAKNSPLCALYQYEWTRAINPQENALVSTMELPFNPFSRQGEDIVVTTRKVVDQLMLDNPDFRILFTGNEVSFYSEMEIAFKSMPLLLSSTCLVVFFLLGIGFQSAFIPIRLSFTVFIPLATVFGLGVMVYQDGLLEFTGLNAFEKTDDGFFWFIPLICLFQALGLVIDYDIFLVHRVQEHRHSGYDMQASIIKAIWEVQTTIISAGLIMSSVFGGLLLSDEIAIDQFGFLLCTSVLLDTFVVQCFLIGPILSLGDTFAWWPKPIPFHDLITLEDGEFK